MIVGEKLANALIGVIVSKIARLRQRLSVIFFKNLPREVDVNPLSRHSSWTGRRVTILSLLSIGYLKMAT